VDFMIPCNDYIINMDNNDHQVMTLHLEIQSIIIFTAMKANMSKVFIHFDIPYSWSLFQSCIKIWSICKLYVLILQLQTQGLNHVDFFFEINIKKCIFTSIWWSVQLCCVAKLIIINIFTDLMRIMTLKWEL
jgi:hypothetical protein